MQETRLEPGASHAEQDSLAAGVIDSALAAGQDSVSRGPDLLPVLREAGVVDAGGYGLTVMLSGIAGALRGTAPVELEHHAPARITHPHHASTTYRYCTNFAVTGSDLDHQPFIRLLEEIGDSVLVVGDATTLKVHVHTDDPNAATALFADAGQVSHLDVADMTEQVADRDARLAGGVASDSGGVSGRSATDDISGAVAVVTGDGFKALFEGFGVAVLDGGPTLNPSTYDLLAAIHAARAEEVVVLTNSSNVFMAAERAAELSDKTVRVVGSRSLQAGLAAAVALDPSRSAAENAAEMEAILEAVRTGGVARAARDDGQGRFRLGDAVGFVDEELVAWGEPEATLRDVIAQLSDGAELITCLTGIDAPLDDPAVRALVDGEVELELSRGGQESYWWLLSAE